MLHRQLSLAEGGMVALGHQDGAPEGEHALSALVNRPRLHLHDAPIALTRLTLVEDAGLGIEGIAVEGRMVVSDLLDLEVGDGAPRDIGHREADADGEDERAEDDALSMLGERLRVVGVAVQRVLVHGEQSEPGVVGLGDGAPGPVLDDLAHRELLVEPSVAHGGSRVSRTRAAGPAPRALPRWTAA